MLVASSGTFGRLQLGQVTATPAEEAQVPRLTNNVLALAQAETQLRTTFAKLVPDVAALAAAGKTVPAELLTLLQDYNRAQATFMEATKIWLQARAQTPKSDLPDPNAQAIAVPTFDLPSAGLGNFFGAAVPASAVKIRYGIIGKEISTSLAGYQNSGFAGYFIGSQLGAAPIAWAIVIIVGLAIVGSVVLGVAAMLRTTDTVAANQAITAQAQKRVEEVKSDRDLYVSTRDTCIGTSQDQSVRLMCIEAARDVLKAAKEGRPTAQKPISPIAVSALTIGGILLVLGAAGGVGYVIYKRRSGSHAPRAAQMRPQSGGYDTDDSEG